MRGRFWGTFFSVCIGAGVAAGGCGGSTDDDSGGGDAFCSGARSKLTSCGLGTWVRSPDFECEGPENAEERCNANCILAGKCEDIVDIFCSPSPSPTTSLAQCVLDCQPPPFQCNSGETVDPDYECDGEDDCSDGSDEHASCPPQTGFTCGSGEIVPESYECDGWEDCSDGSDEHSGCPPPPPDFTCESGEMIPASWKCDGQEDCADGSDEPADCPPDPREQACQEAR